jgi:hypothetical protein
MRSAPLGPPINISEKCTRVCQTLKLTPYFFELKLCAKFQNPRTALWEKSNPRRKREIEKRQLTIQLDAFVGQKLF